MYVVCNKCGATFPPQNIKVIPEEDGSFRILLKCSECKEEETIAVISILENEEEFIEP
jgi:RNase P subunit RPR2